MKNYGDWFRQKDRIIKTKATELMLDSFVYSQLDKRQNEQNVQNDRILFFMRQSFVFLLEISNSLLSLCEWCRCSFSRY